MEDFGVRSVLGIALASVGLLMTMTACSANSATTGGGADSASSPAGAAAGSPALGSGGPESLKVMDAQSACSAVWAVSGFKQLDSELNGGSPTAAGSNQIGVFPAGADPQHGVTQSLACEYGGITTTWFRYPSDAERAKQLVSAAADTAAVDHKYGVPTPAPKVIGGLTGSFMTDKTSSQGQYSFVAAMGGSQAINLNIVSSPGSPIPADTDKVAAEIVQVMAGIKIQPVGG